jgi:hypothetical protein
MKVGVGPGAKKQDPVKVTDNSFGWAAVAGIPVPPAAEARTFHKPLGEFPKLVNGGVIQREEFEKINLMQAGLDLNAKIDLNVKPMQSKEGAVRENALPTVLSFTNQTITTKSVEIDWYGAKLLIQCLNAVYHRADVNRGGQEWLMLEISLDKETLKPIWRPPVAQLGENGRISIPEFYCTVDKQTLKCQVLNIELLDLKTMKYVLVLRVLN